MGMRQRLALAAALLGDPRVLVLDEPANGLDPEGIRWLRGFLSMLSREQGKTVLVSSHLLQEIAQTADDVVIIANAAKFHPMHAMAAIQAGKHVFVEKPHAIDPAGIKEVRELLRSLGAEGRTVFVSSHLLSEVQQTCDRVAVLARGRCVGSRGGRHVIRAEAGDGFGRV